MCQNDIPKKILNITDLTFGYDADNPILKNINLTVEAGKIHVLLGPNATGKTTLLRLILGLQSPDQGSIAIAGQDNVSLDPRQRARLLSYVPQQSSSSFGYDVQQVVGMGRLAIGPDPQQVQQAMAQADVLKLSHRPFTHLSAGQQQRVLLARAMAQIGSQTVAMLLDEPISAMDLSRSHQMMLHLRTLAQRGLGIVVVLHDLNLAMQYADTVWVMEQGQMQAVGDWQAVMTPQILGSVYKMEFECLEHPFQKRPILLSRPVVQ